ncbi:MAG: pentapeptide repeat-containing protein [Thainema sp.]
MWKKVLAGCGGVGLLAVLLGAGGLYWLTRPANIDWRSRSRDGFSDFRAVDWSGKNLAGADLSGLIFREAWLNRANLRNANLRGTDFSGATYLEEADLRGADLSGALFQATIAEQANFTEAVLRGVNFQYANLSGANLSNADLQGAVMENTNLSGANLSGTNLEGVTLAHADLTGANLSGWQHPPITLAKANLTQAILPAESTALDNVRLCNTILPSGEVSQRDCFVPTAVLETSFENQDWQTAETETSVLFNDAKYDANWEEIALDPPCADLERLNALWEKASNGRFSYAVQRQIWESPAVNQDYGKFAIAVGWQQNGDWLKFDELNFSPEIVSDSTIPVGYLPWHRWQVLEPTEKEPTRFRREGFGRWMAKLKQCGI